MCSGYTETSWESVKDVGHAEWGGGYFTLGLYITRATSGNKQRKITERWYRAAGRSRVDVRYKETDERRGLRRTQEEAASPWGLG